MPFHRACRKGHLGVVKALLDHGADVNLKNQVRGRHGVGIWFGGDAHLPIVRSDTIVSCL
jgi:ankyrin repeat protein